MGMGEKESQQGESAAAVKHGTGASDRISVDQNSILQSVDATLQAKVIPVTRDYPNP